MTYARIITSSRSQRGAVLAEYALATALLIGTFAVAGRILLEASYVRSLIMSESLESTAPCSNSDGRGILLHERQNACK